MVGIYRGMGGLMLVSSLLGAVDGKSSSHWRASLDACRQKPGLYQQGSCMRKSCVSEADINAQQRCLVNSSNILAKAAKQIGCQVADMELKPLLRAINRCERANRQLVRISSALDYSYGYAKSLACFMNENRWVDNEATKKWLVLVNIHHPDVPLNTTNAYVPGTRTLQWATPLSYAASRLNKANRGHDLLALPKDWSRGQLRSRVTFIFIPPKTKMSFYIGYASPQTDTTLLDPRSGGGVQMRLRFVPAGAIVMETALLQKSSKRSQSRDQHPIDLPNIARRAASTLKGLTTSERRQLTQALDNRSVYFGGTHFDIPEFMSHIFGQAGDQKSP